MSALVCLFLATWHHCRCRAVADVESRMAATPRVIAPFVLQVTRSDNVTVRRTHHLWCFGAILELPLSSEYPETGGFTSAGVRPRIIIQAEEMAR